MKKITAVILIFAMTVVLCSCFEQKSEPQESVTSSADSQSQTSASAETKSQASSASSPKNSSKTQTHKHSFSAATCTAPGKCSCGATSGSPKGHVWASATCTSPKTCKVCGAAEGGKAPHNISDKTSKCTVCGAFAYNINYALRECLNKANKRNADFFDSYRILNVYYVEDNECLCDTQKSDKYISVFIYFRYVLDGEEGWDVDVYDIHKVNESGYSVDFSNINILYTYNDADEIVKIRTEDYSVYYDNKSLKKVDLGAVL